MFDYQKYAKSAFTLDPAKLENGKGLDLKADRAVSAISLSTTSSEDDELEINEYFLCGQLQVFKLLPWIAGSCLVFEAALAISTIETPVAFTFLLSTFCTLLIMFVSSRGVRKELIKLVKSAFYLLLVKFVYLFIQLIGAFTAFQWGNVFFELFKFTLPSTTLVQLLVILSGHILTLSVQVYLTLRSIDIIRRRDLIYVISPPVGPTKMRPSLKLIGEKLRNQNLGVQAF